MSDDDWETDPNYINDVTEKQQRYGSKSVPGSGRQGFVNFCEIINDTKSNQKTGPKEKIIIEKPVIPVEITSPSVVKPTVLPNKIDKNRYKFLLSQSTESNLKAEVLFDYNKEEEDELELKKGDIITNIDKSHPGWWKGTINGKDGVFPANYVKDI